jgi:hypothetical protein
MARSSGTRGTTRSRLASGLRRHHFVAGERATNEDATVREIHVAHFERADLAHAKTREHGERDRDAKPTSRVREERRDVVVARRVGELLALTRERRDVGHARDLTQLDGRTQHGANEREMSTRLNAARGELRRVLTHRHVPRLVEATRAELGEDALT